MENSEQYQSRIIRKKDELWVPYNGGETGFVSQPIGLANYENSGKQILKDGLEIPTGDELASLNYSAYFSNKKNEPEFVTIRNINGFWIFNRNLWTENGVYVVHDSEAIGTGKELDVNDLEEMLKDGEEISGVRFSKDEKRRFAPKGSYTLRRKLSSEDFAKDGFVIASCGKEEAEKLGEIYAENKSLPCNQGFEIKRGMKPIQTVSAFMNNIIPGIDGNRVSNLGLNYAFGALPKN